LITGFEEEVEATEAGRASGLMTLTSEVVARGHEDSSFLLKIEERDQSVG